jgi:hypothetical protein
MKRRSTTAFDRYSYQILDVVDLADEWESTPYSPQDFFTFFDAIFNVDISNPNWDQTTQFNFVRNTRLYLSSRATTQELGGDVGPTLQLKALFAAPILIFNNIVYQGPLPDDMGKSISLANPSYRVVLSSS